MPVPPLGPVLRRLLSWYLRAKRDLPWRRVSDPYRIWVSETMLQQTRVETVIPYYERFLEEFPTVRALARAGLDDVLKAWEGLGYYGRARNLHRAAGRIVDAHRGKFPRTLEEARGLPGVGRYTAGAVLSIAYGERTPVVDGNVARVLCRFLAIRRPPARPAVQKRLWKEALRWVSGPSPGERNQALMELGATVCVPENPLCLLCPLSPDCRARILGLAERLPAREVPKPLPARAGTALLLRRSGKMLVVRRPEKGLLGGLWGFPSAFDADPKRAKSALADLARTERVSLSSLGECGRVEHTFTHFHLELDVLEGEARPGAGARARVRNEKDRRWVSPEELEDLALSALDRKIAKITQA